MSYLSENILSTVRALPEGSLISPEEFLHLASRSAVDKTLSRLTQEGKLIRVSQEAYVAPHQGRFGSRPPSTESVVHAIEATGRETVVANGAAEANALGLTTQVPTREVFFTSGRSRKLQLGNRCIELKHGNRWQLLLGKRPSGMAIRALGWLGPEMAESVLVQIKANLPEAEWQAILGVRDLLPSWMARLVSEATFNV